VRRVLSDTKTFIKGVDYTSQFSVFFGEGLVTSNGERHKADRSCFGKYFIRSNVSKYMKMANERVVELMESSITPGKPQNIEEFFAILSLRVFMSFSTNTDYRNDPAKEKEICHLVANASWATGRMITLGLPIWDIFPPTRIMKKCRSALCKEIKILLENRRASMQRGEDVDVDDCLSTMITNNLSDVDVADHMVTLIAAGHDTTAFFSAYMCMILAQHQDCQDILRKEIFDQLGTRTEITADDVTEMKYLQKVMQETLRLYAIIPCVSRASTEEVHVKEANVTIPKGSNVLIPMFLINRDPEIWDNPTEFRPDRFEGKGNEFTSAKNGFFPFGYGSRTCIGNVLAQMESAVFLCQILRKYRIDEEPGFKPAIFAGISLTTSNGINVILNPL